MHIRACKRLRVGLPDSVHPLINRKLLVIGGYGARNSPDRISVNGGAILSTLFRSLDINFSDSVFATADPGYGDGGTDGNRFVNSFGYFPGAGRK